MSFYVEFTAASHDDALRIVLAEEILPDCVRTFICQAVEAYPAAAAIYVKAVGHLYSEDYEVSSERSSFAKSSFGSQERDHRQMDRYHRDMEC